MSVEQVAAAHYQTQQTLSRATVEQAQTLWAQVNPSAVLESWLAVLDAVIQLLAAGQVTAAALAQPYLNAVARQQGVPPQPAGQINPAAFAGVAASGQALTSLLMQPALRTLGLLARGADDQDALRSGLAALVRIVDTEIADASRTADQAGITANRRWVSYIRVVTLPACGRCIILAGTVYRWSTGFLRHPQCDCSMVPFHEGDTRPADPKRLFDQMTPQQQAKAFTVAGAESIRLGADPGRVVHARRGMHTAGGQMVTRAGAKRRTLRLMPEQILADAAGDREQAIAQLRRHGYLT